MCVTIEITYDNIHFFLSAEKIPPHLVFLIYFSPFLNASISFFVSSITETTIIMDVPKNDIFDKPNTPPKVIGTKAITESPNAPNAIVFLTVSFIY